VPIGKYPAWQIAWKVRVANKLCSIKQSLVELVQELRWQGKLWDGALKEVTSNIVSGAFNHRKKLMDIKSHKCWIETRMYCKVDEGWYWEIRKRNEWCKVRGWLLTGDGDPALCWGNWYPARQVDIWELDHYEETWWVTVKNQIAGHTQYTWQYNKHVTKPLCNAVHVFPRT